MNRTVRRIALVLPALVALALAVGCSPSGTKSASSTGASGSAEPTAAVRIGTLPTEDSLPLWVAENKGYFAAQGIPKVEIVEFQSAQERDAAFVSGAIDGYMGDIIAAANLTAAGKANTIQTVMLGADQGQGRFGVAKAPPAKGQGGLDDETASAGLAALENVPVGTSSATIQEYVLDGLMAEAGVATSSVKVEEVKKVPVRFQLLMAGKLKAAALPEPFLSLAEQGGAKVIADDTMARSNLSQTILAFSNAYLAKPGGAAAVAGVQEAWDLGAIDINTNPTAFRPLLVEKAKLPKALESTYEVNSYPTQLLPREDEVTAVLAWMKTKGYLKTDVTYAQLTGQGK
jgi:NitT/TauT family transport system substrate-binding protein